MGGVVDLWRRLPEPARARAHRTVQAISRAAVPWWLPLAWRKGHAPAPDARVTVAGLARSSIGIGQGARLFASALQYSGFPTGLYDAGVPLRGACDLAPMAQIADAGASPGGVVVSHLNPPELARLLEATHGRVLRGARHVGYWAWELSVAPSDWRPAFGYVDEVWVPSHFTAGALRGLGPADTPVHVVPHPVWAWGEGDPDPARFGLPDDACRILVALDLRSTAARKNPSGALEAFRRATSDARGQACVLACKISGARAEPALFESLRAECGRRDDMVLIDETLSGADMRALVASVDIVFSPHRAEGFGLLLAEGMRMGKAVVATGWSGNMDFMDEDCAALVDYALTPVVDPQGMYRDAQWAEPDLDHAAEALARLIREPARRRSLGTAAAARGGPVFDPAAWRALVAQRLFRS